jgi:hypothetical protein
LPFGNWGRGAGKAIQAGKTIQAGKALAATGARREIVRSAIRRRRANTDILRSLRLSAAAHSMRKISLMNVFLAGTLLACNLLPGAAQAAAAADISSAERAQLSIGYSLLYQEADGIPKLKWILMFKDKPEQMGRLSNDLVGYYQQLADTMRRLSKQYPAMRIDVTAMSEIESEERKAIGEDMAKDFAPVVGKTGVKFEREALLMFYDTLNEQRHLTQVMVEREPDPALKKFLETTQAQLEARYAKVGAILNRRYFTQ